MLSTGASMIEPSERSRTISYAIREVIVPAKKLEQQGHTVLHLNIGDPNKYDFDTPNHMKKALYEAVQQGFNGYAPAEGFPQLRAEICKREKKRNKLTYNIQDVCVTTGVTEALQLLLNVLLNANDELLIPGPTYPQYTLITQFNGAKPIPYRCIEEENWQPDVDDIRRKISPKTKAIIIINPNNPTGALYPDKVLKKICDLAGEHNIPIISDEIYDEITFDHTQTATASLAKDLPVITLNGFSKLYLIPGWRMGYILFRSPELADIQDAFLRIARSRLCANSICQQACIKALTGPQDHIKPMLQKLKKRRDFAYKRLNEIPGISTAKPDGAFYIFPRIDAMSTGKWNTDKDFVLDLLHKQQVLVVHGSGFCTTYGKDHFRVVILPQLETLTEAFDRIERFMQ